MPSFERTDCRGWGHLRSPSPDSTVRPTIQPTPPGESHSPGQKDRNENEQVRASLFIRLLCNQRGDLVLLLLLLLQQPAREKDTRTQLLQPQMPQVPGSNSTLAQPGTECNPAPHRRWEVAADRLPSEILLYHDTARGAWHRTRAAPTAAALQPFAWCKTGRAPGTAAKGALSRQ